MSHSAAAGRAGAMVPTNRKVPTFDDEAMVRRSILLILSLSHFEGRLLGTPVVIPTLAVPGSFPLVIEGSLHIFVYCFGSLVRIACTLARVQTWILDQEQV